jgi:spore coat polysaccharide biosynthesis predicted glycosyltransferase SpsG/RimJ/RimL family protein N-acetyltransferase
MREMVIRADASRDVGAGHVMRCLGLARAWNGAGLGSARVWGRVDIPFVRAEAEKLGVNVSDDVPGSGGVLVVDSYDQRVRSDALERRAGLGVLVDDLGGAVPESADVIWNPNAYGAQDLYPQTDRPVIAGERAVPIRPELPAWRGSDSSTIAVSLGASQSAARYADALAMVAQACDGYSFATSGSWAPDGWKRIAPEDFWPQVKNARCLITAGGATVWEASAVGIPAVVVAIADNQRLVTEWARSHGAPVVVAAGESSEAVARSIGGAVGQARPLPPLRDGAPNVAAQLDSIVRARTGETALVLRPATKDDARLLWEWANDPATREASFGRGEIPWTSHLSWLDRQLASDGVLLLIAALSDGTLAGTIRFDTSDEWKTAHLSYSIAPKMRGHGLSRPLLVAGTRWMRIARGRAQVHAEVLSTNAASIKAFRGLAWTESVGDRAGSRLFRYTLAET